MLKNIRTGLNFLRYGYQAKLNFFTLLIFSAVGIFIEFITKGTNFLGAFYLICSILFIYQQILSITFSEYIQTSYMKRKLQLTIPIATSSIFYFVLFTAILIEKYALIQAMPQNHDKLVMALISTELFMLITFIFCSICYKYFAFACALLFSLSLIALLVLTIMFRTSLAPVILNLPYALLAVSGFAIIIIGAVIEYFVGCLLYNAPLSKIAFSMSAKK